MVVTIDRVKINSPDTCTSSPTFGMYPSVFTFHPVKDTKKSTEYLENIVYQTAMH